MKQFKSDLIQTLFNRGYINQCTHLDELDEKASKETITGYIGFDATADSLHVGSLVQIMLLRILQKTGHRPIVIMGGGTTKIGDPSGKDESRKLLTDDLISQNIDKIKLIFNHYLTFGSGPKEALMINNNDWLGGLKYIDFLRDIGTHFTINRMLTFDSVKLRLEREQPLTFLEFNYMLLQAYDFYQLAKDHNCSLQMGGADQWGNIVSGLDLTRRLIQKDVYGLTTHLITTSSGAKMGKTANGAVWLNKDRLSAYDFWQFWRNVEDADVGRFLRLFTEIPLSEVERLESLQGQDINQAKIILANEVTKLCHGEAEASHALQTAQQTFAGTGKAEGLPTITLKAADLEAILLVDLFVQTGLTESKGEARRLIQGGGARLNDQAITDPNAKPALGDFDADQELKLSSGKKRHAIVKLG